MSAPSTSLYARDFPPFDDSLKIDQWVKMVLAAFEPLTEDVTTKKLILIKKMPIKYYSFLMDQFDKTLEEMLDAVNKEIRDERIDFTFLHTRFDALIHEPAAFVENKIKICEKKRYGRNETVHTIAQCLPGQFQWFANMDQKDSLILAMNTFCEKKKAQAQAMAKPKFERFDGKPKGDWCYTCAANKRPANHNFRTCVHAKQFKRKGNYNNYQRDLKKPKTNEMHLVEETPKDAEVKKPSPLSILPILTCLSTLATADVTSIVSKIADRAELHLNDFLFTNKLVRNLNLNSNSKLKSIIESQRLVEFQLCVNNRSVNALFDSGATSTVMDENMAKLLGVKITRENISLNSGKIQCLGSTIILISICNEVRSCKVYIVKHRTLRNRLLFGLNAIAEYGLYLTEKLEIASHKFEFLIPTNYSNRLLADDFNDSLNLLVRDYDSLLDQLTEKAKSESEVHLIENYHSSEAEALAALKKSINPNLSEDYSSKFLEILKSRDVFSKNKFDVGVIRDVKCTIPFNESFAHPFASPYPFTNVKDELKMREIIDSLLENNIIRKSFSDFAAPALLVLRRDENEKNRLCINFRALNDRCDDMNYPFPKISALIDKLHGSRYFTKLDIANGFWNIEMDPADIHKTSFITPFGQFEWLKMPFGYKNSPAIFQRAIYNVIRKHNLENFTHNYFDDIVIHSRTLEEHLVHVDLVLQAIQAETIRLKLSKCEFAMNQVEYLGHTVSLNRVEPKNSNIDAIVNFPTPNSKKKVQQFVGKVNYCRRFIHNISDILYPLTELTKDGVKFVWSKFCEASFNKCKEILTSKPVLMQFNDFEHCYLFTDASGIGVSGILKQKQSDGALHPVGYFSRKLKSYEKSYSPTELELLAVVNSVAYWKHYLYKQKFTVITDHQAITYLKNFKHKNDKLTRWKMLLEQYNFDVYYREGRLNVEADCLSRNPIDDRIEKSNVELFLLDRDEIINALDTNFIGRYLDDSNFVYESDLLFKIDDERNRRIVVPEQLVDRLISKFHLKYCHVGTEKIVFMIRQNYYVKDLHKKVQSVCQNCETCIKNKSRFDKQLGFLGKLGPPKDNFDLISIDTVGGFSNANSPKEYLHIAIDHFSRYVWFTTSKTRNADDYINLVSIVLKSKPNVQIKNLLADKYPGFNDKSFRNFLKRNQINFMQIPSNVPSANGLAERVIQTLVNSIRCNFYDQKLKPAWTSAARSAIEAYNNCVHLTTKFSPSYLLTGTEWSRSCIPTADSVADAAQYEEDKLKAYQNSVKANVRNAFYTNRYRKNYSFEKDQIVFFCDKNKLNRKKLDPIFEGPATVIEQKSKQIYLVKFKDKFVTVHKSNLRVRKDERLEFEPKIGQEVYFENVRKVSKIVKETRFYGPAKIVEQLSDNLFVINHEGKTQTITKDKLSLALINE